MTPQEYYENEFPNESKLTKGIESTQLMSLESCFMLMEMYHKTEMIRELK